MAGPGYLEWASRPYTKPIEIDGQPFLVRKLADSPLTFGYPNSSMLLLPTVAGTSVVQRLALGGDMPLTMHPASVSFSFLVWYEDEEAFPLMRMHRPAAISLYVGDVMEDVWDMTMRNTGQVAYKTSRPLAYNGTTITHATHPPRAWVDGVEAPVVTGAPAAGEVQVAAVSAATLADPLDTITLHSGIAATGSELRFRYGVRPYVRAEVSKTLPTTNALMVAINATEILAGTYTPQEAAA